MAHPARVKAAALAMLICGESVTATATATGIPKQTISRWKRRDLQRYLRPIVAASPELQELARSVEWLRRLRPSLYYGTKKGAKHEKS